jgi:ankyrin repeat protein
MLATDGGCIPVMKALLDAGADVNLKGYADQTALTRAAMSRMSGIQSFELLLAHGADPTVADFRKKTVLMWLVDPQGGGGDSPASIKALIDAGAPVNAQDNLGQTAMMWIFDSGYMWLRQPQPLLKALVDNGGDVNLTDQDGATVMFDVLRYFEASDMGGQLDADVRTDWMTACVQILLNGRANPNVRNNAGKTALSFAGPDAELLKGMGFTQ